MPVLLTRVHSPHEAWDILRNSTKNLTISETFLPLWDWLRVRLITDYVGDLYSRLAHLPMAPQSEAITKNRVALLRQVIPTLAPNPTVAIPEPIASSIPYNLPFTSSPAKKLWAALQRINLPDLHFPLATMPHTQPIPGALTIMAAA